MTQILWTTLIFQRGHCTKQPDPRERPLLDAGIGQNYASTSTDVSHPASDLVDRVTIDPKEQGSMVQLRKLHKEQNSPIVHAYDGQNRAFTSYLLYWESDWNQENKLHLIRTVEKGTPVFQAYLERYPNDYSHDDSVFETVDPVDSSTPEEFDRIAFNSEPTKCVSNSK